MKAMAATNENRETPSPGPELLNALQDGEKAYPIYHIRAKWPIDIDHDVENLGPRWFEGLAVGRMWNGTDWDEMPKEPQSFADLRKKAFGDWWPKYKRKGNNPGELTITVTFQRWETWSIQWFSHWAHDIGLTDQQVLLSFQRFVWRTQETNRREGEVKNGYRQEPYCLMGAEDRDRWAGSTTGERGAERTDPPCRCPHCKERGVVIIGH